MIPERDDLSHPIHRPVMVSEVLGLLLPAGGGGLFVDGTVGLGGHAEALLDAGGGVRLLGLDRDPEALAFAHERLRRFGDRFRPVHASYADLEAVLRGAEAPRGVLLDLGVSSFQLDDPRRGFSFTRGREGADMRFDPSGGGPTALDLANALSEKELARILFEYGDEPRSRAVARRLVRARPIPDAETLARIVRSAALRRGRLDPATRSFQALRIAVNDELGHLERGLQAALRVVASGGRVVVIAFHSGEDRRVKTAFREAAKAGLGRVLTKKPLRPTDEETRTNPRARPSRLRAFAKEGREGVPDPERP